MMLFSSFCIKIVQILDLEWNWERERWRNVNAERRRAFLPRKQKIHPERDTSVADSPTPCGNLFLRSRRTLEFVIKLCLANGNKSTKQNSVTPTRFFLNKNFTLYKERTCSPFSFLEMIACSRSLTRFVWQTIFSLRIN